MGFLSFPEVTAPFDTLRHRSKTEVRMEPIVVGKYAKPTFLFWVASVLGKSGFAGFAQCRG